MIRKSYICLNDYEKYEAKQIEVNYDLRVDEGLRERIHEENIAVHRFEAK